MWIAVDSSLMVFYAKPVIFVFYYHYFLCVVHPQTVKLLSRVHTFTYRVDIIPSSTHSVLIFFSSSYNLENFLCNFASIAVNFGVIFFGICVSIMVKLSLIYS